MHDPNAVATRRWRKTSDTAHVLIEPEKLFFDARGKGKNRSGVDFFDSFLTRLEKLGWSRRPDQTPLEFIRGLPPSSADSVNLDWIVDLYYRQRFAGVAPNREDRTRVREIVKALEIARPSNRP